MWQQQYVHDDHIKSDVEEKKLYLNAEYAVTEHS